MNLNDSLNIFKNYCDKNNKKYPTKYIELNMGFIFYIPTDIWSFETSYYFVSDNGNIIGTNPLHISDKDLNKMKDL